MTDSDSPQFRRSGRRSRRGGPSCAVELARQERERQVPLVRGRRDLVRRGRSRGRARPAAAGGRGHALHRRLGAHPYRLFSAGRTALSQRRPLGRLSDHARACAPDRRGHRACDIGRERRAPIASLGVGALVAGVLTMGASGLAHGRIDRPTILVALANSAVIAVYSVIDGQGARLSGAGAAFAFAYNSWADALTALAYLPIILCLRGRAVARRLFARAGGAALSAASPPFSAMRSSSGR